MYLFLLVCNYYSLIIHILPYTDLQHTVTQNAAYDLRYDVNQGLGDGLFAKNDGSHGDRRVNVRLADMADALKTKSGSFLITVVARFINERVVTNLELQSARFASYEKPEQRLMKRRAPHV